ncbi:MAG: hypothetical protein KKB30_06895, partial [Proteobacteria bacterium]|nr:hypothetical protein [Pseudomonadota bacterium]MBU1715444.1 hypothetical protein [Pseudomonadota bacterium]
IDTSGNFSIATPNLSYSGVGVIGTISEASGTANDGTVTGGAMLTINFNASATNAIIQELTRAIAYRSTSNNPTGTNTTRTVTFTLTDKNAGTGNDTSTITITPQNDPPTDIALDNANVSEEQPSNTVVGTLTITDPDN